MANTIRIKRRSSTGSPGQPTGLANAELAFNEADPNSGVLYYGWGTGGVGGTATTALPIGGPGAFVALAGAQTITGNKTITGAYDFTGGTLKAATQIGTDNSTNVATTAFVKALNYLTGNQTITLSGDATGSGATAITVSLKNTGTAGTYTKVTTDAQGRVTSGTTLSASDIPTLTASKISDFNTAVQTNRLDQLAAPTAAVSLNGQNITNLATPINATDAASKGYVDSVAQGLDAKASVKAGTTANITLSGTQTIDGVAVVAGDRVLVKNQTTASQNGIYVVASGAWTRATDMNTWANVPDAFTFVEQGTVNADTGWVCISDQGGTLDTTAINWTQFSGAGTYQAGNGLTLSGSIFSAVGTANRISISASGIDISSSYVGQSSITTLGTITTGTWNGSTIAVANGGTGVATLSGVVFANGTSAFTAATGSQIASAIGSTAVTNATNATNLAVSDNSSSSSSVYLTWVSANTGNVAHNTTSTKLTFVPSTGVLSATGFAGSGASLTNLNASNLASGTVPSATVSGSYTGITGVGTITAGTWNANVISVAYGGTGVATITGLVKGNGTSAFTAAVDGVDYLSPSATIDGGTY